MIAGASWGWWLGFHGAVLTLLLVDAFLPANRSEEPRTQTTAWIWTGVLVAATALFAIWIAVGQSHHNALEFVAGYAIETSLSVDNLFVFLVLFQGFRISEKRQHTALLWGVAGAIILRALFIAAGVTLIQRFEWISWIFGLFLLYAAYRLVARRFRACGNSGVDSTPATGKGFSASSHPCRRIHRRFVCRGFHSRSAGSLPRPVRCLHLKHRRNSRTAVALLRAGRVARSPALPALRPRRHAGICCFQDACLALAGGADHHLAGHHGRDPGDLRGGFVDCREEARPHCSWKTG